MTVLRMAVRSAQGREHEHPVGAIHQHQGQRDGRGSRPGADSSDPARLPSSTSQALLQSGSTRVGNHPLPIMRSTALTSKATAKNMNSQPLMLKKRR